MSSNYTIMKKMSTNRSKMSELNENDNSISVSPNSESNLDELFNSVLNPNSKRPLQVPWHLRNLPNSFFTPPSTGSKSPTLQGNHSRAHSSPASLQQTLCIRQPPLNHMKQKSYDGHNPLPPGWEQGRTPQGQIYYMNHNTRTTTWEDPRTNIYLADQEEFDDEIPQSSSDVCSTLPDGWEQNQTADGVIYFINHNTKSTSWVDPRILQMQSTQVESNSLNEASLRMMRPNELVLRTMDVLPSITDHGRQESVDSGLGDHSLPQTPDGLLDDVSMDSVTTIKEELDTDVFINSNFN